MTINQRYKTKVNSVYFFTNISLNYYYYFVSLYRYKGGVNSKQCLLSCKLLSIKRSMVNLLFTTVYFCLLSINNEII